VGAVGDGRANNVPIMVLLVSQRDSAERASRDSETSKRVDVIKEQSSGVRTIHKKEKTRVVGTG